MSGAPAVRTAPTTKEAARGTLLNMSATTWEFPWAKASSPSVLFMNAGAKTAPATGAAAIGRARLMAPLPAESAEGAEAKAHATLAESLDDESATTGAAIGRAR